MFINNIFLPINSVKPIKQVSKEPVDEMYRKIIETNFQWFLSAYYGGCAYTNFVTIFKVLLERNFNTHAKHCAEFDLLWDKIFPDERAVIHHWNSTLNHIGSHMKQLCELLETLHNENK